MTPVAAPLITGTSRRFAERSDTAALDLYQDQYGFLQPSARFFGPDQLLARPCTLVLAPPWVGKSYTARQIVNSLTPLEESDRPSQPRFLEFTDLEARILGQPLAPSWWREWSRSRRTATWIYDALEEGQRREASLCPALVRLLEELAPKARQRLRLLAFAREGDLRQVYPQLEARLRDLYGNDFLVAELLPLDLDNARELIRQQGGSDADWRQVLDLIESSQLQRVAGYPAVLSFLYKQRGSAALSVREVWQGVLQQLLAEHHYHPQPQPFDSEPERRFAAAARIAAVLTLTGNEDLASEENPPGLPDTARTTLRQVIADAEPRYPQLATRAAAREALRSAMFRTTGDSHRFVHRNARDWMAAFGMARLPQITLRAVLLDVPGAAQSTVSIRPELSDLARLLAEVHEVPAVRDWLRLELGPLPSDLFIASAVEVRSVLDRLEELAAGEARPDGLDDPQTLRRLAMANLDRELAERLLDATKPALARIMLLRIGVALELEAVVRAATAIVADGSQDERLRQWCAAIAGRAAGIELLRTLQDFVERSVPATREQMAIASSLISGFVRTGLWTAARGFGSMPPDLASDLADAMQALAFALIRSMGLGDAERIVSDLGPAAIEALAREAEQRHREGRWPPPPRWQVYSAAVKLIASTEPMDPAMLRRLIPVASTLPLSERELVPCLEKAFLASETGRRELFLAVVAARKASGAAAHWHWADSLLDAKDLPWLLDHLMADLADGMPLLWLRALRLADGTDDTVLRRRVYEATERRAPQALAAYQEAREQERQEQEEEPARQAAETAPMRAIAEVDRELLASSRLSEQERFWQLAWANFSEARFRPRNLAGEWTDLPAALQEQVLDACAGALDSILPTPVTEGLRYPRVLRYEAEAFVALLRYRPERFALTAARAERWLPAVLKVYHPERVGVLEAGLQSVPVAVERILLEAIARELRESAYSILLQDLPASLWTDGVVRWVAGGIEGAQPAEASAILLELLAARRPDEALRLSRSVLAARPLARILAVHEPGGQPDRLGLRALEILLALAPDEAWPRIKEGAALGGKDLLEQLRGFGPGAPEGLRIDWSSWPPERILELAEVLFAAYPREQDPPETEGGVLVTRDFELRQLRWQLLGHLVQLPTPQASAAVESAMEVLPQARAFIERLQRSRAADDLLSRPRGREGGRGVGATHGVGLDAAAACQLLDDEHWRLIRSADDLLEVVVEELGKLEVDLGYDHALLFSPGGQGKAEKHRREEALQAYIIRRLQDRLPGKLIDREAEVKRGRRLDIRVLARLYGSDDWATTVIEIKWSDSRGVSTSLVDQLGKAYLLEEHFRHGVYLVGWTGKLARWQASLPPPHEQSATALLEALRRQADDFRREHATIDLRPIVWDVRREAAPAAAVRKAVGKKAVRKNAAAKKTAARKAPAKRGIVKKAAAKKTGVGKTTARKTAAKK
ncbi:MAG TPA: hypothetical protein VMW75_19385 [Thermoanaerobaculia bacterium]|nr:hypothetical protein [Thermoanaerobaculia bacterium]